MTTAVWLECPVCEYRFSVPPEYLEKSGKCPKCENVFQASECQLPEKELADDLKEPAIPLPAVLGDLPPGAATPLSPPTPRPPQAAPPKSQAPGESLEVGDEANADVELDKTYVPAEKKQTDPNKVLMWVSVSCILAIALLIGIPALATMLVDQGEGDSSSGVAVNEVNGNGSDSKADKGQRKGKGRGKGKGRKAKSKRKTPRLKKNVKDFTPEEFRTIWDKCYTGIALVNSKFGKTNRTSHGIVISSNGQVAVSLSCVEGADSVRVRFALSEYGSEQRWSEPLVATTISSSKPHLDLAIIKVDASTKPVETRTQPVEFNERGVIPVLSNKNSNEFLRLTKLRPAVAFSDLAEDDKSSITSLPMTPEGNDYFLVHSAKLNKSGSGAPIFDESGRLVGMHVAHNEASKSSFLIPPATLRKVLNDPLSKPVPIKNVDTKLASAKKSATSPRTVTPKNFEEAIGVMNDSAWKFETPVGYQNAQNFAAAWWKANVEYRTADFTRRNKIEDLKKEMVAKMAKLLYWPNMPADRTVNEMATQAFRNKDNGIVALVSVLKPAGISVDVDGEPALLVQFSHTGEKALLVPGEVEGPFLQGSSWIVFGWNPDSRRINTPEGICMVIHVAGVQKK